MCWANWLQLSFIAQVGEVKQLTGDLRGEILCEGLAGCKGSGLTCSGADIEAVIAIQLSQSQGR